MSDSPPMNPAFFDRTTRLLLVLWGLLLAAGGTELFAYSVSNGAVALAPFDWPKSTALQHDTMGSMVVFLHPHCPCSSATMSEVERLMPKLRNRARVFLVFIRPENRPTEWLHSNLWDRAQRIKGVTVYEDFGFKEASRFGAEVSGQTYFYDGNGLLVLNGGLTPGRGHEGFSAGQQAILQWLDGKASGIAKTQAFGCTLRSGKEPWKENSL